jgi:DNA repair photolyase
MLAQHARRLVRRSLELIRDHSTLNVRILTRSPLARSDFDLFKSFGPRLLFGMSLPTLRNDVARIYEPSLRDICVSRRRIWAERSTLIPQLRNWR